MSWRKNLSRWSNEGQVLGLPEMDLFPDEETRTNAIRELNRGFYTWKIIPVLVVHCIVLLLAFFGVVEIVRPLTPRWAGWISMAIVLVAYGLFIHFAVRRDMVKALRSKLIEAGVAVCLKCGYDLRGQPAAAHPRCPECGRAYQADTPPLDSDGPR